jgi:hypothetical protein
MGCKPRTFTEIPAHLHVQAPLESTANWGARNSGRQNRRPVATEKPSCVNSLMVVFRRLAGFAEKRQSDVCTFEQSVFVMPWLICLHQNEAHTSLRGPAAHLRVSGSSFASAFGPVRRRTGRQITVSSQRPSHNGCGGPAHLQARPFWGRRRYILRSTNAHP